MGGSPAQKHHPHKHQPPRVAAAALLVQTAQLHPPGVVQHRPPAVIRGQRQRYEHFAARGRHISARPVRADRRRRAVWQHAGRRRRGRQPADEEHYQYSQ